MLCRHTTLFCPKLATFCSPTGNAKYLVLAEDNEKDATRVTGISCNDTPRRTELIEELKQK